MSLIRLGTFSLQLLLPGTGVRTVMAVDYAAIELGILVAGPAGRAVVAHIPANDRGSDHSASG